MECRISSLYVCVKDMNRAVAFYENLLGQHVMERDDVYSVFDVGGFRFGLFAFEKMNEKHSWGSNCLPSITFPDKDVLENKLAKYKIVFPLTRIKDNWVAEIVDSEDNHIEVTASV